MFTLAFWRAAGERAVRAFAGSLLSLWVVGDGVLDLRGVDWPAAAGVGAGAALVSLLLSLVAGAGVGPVGSPSFVPDPAAAEDRPV